MAAGGPYRKNTMNRINAILLLTFLAVISLTGYAQPLQNMKKAKAYFAEHIQQLEPIEGIYDVENAIELFSAYAGWESIKQHFVCAILKSSDCYYVHSFEGDVQGLIGSIEKMSGPKSYSFEKVDGNGNMKKIHFQLNDLFSFELNEENTNRSAKSRVFTKFIKKYPTLDMYAELEQAEETNEPTQWSGTGFALTNNHIVTNFHVVEEAKSISVQGINGNFNNKYSATVIATDKVNDLAILKINGANISNSSIPYSVKTTTSEVGEDIFVLGYPLTSTMGDEIKLTTGVISSKSGFQGDVSLYQISAPIQPGNSDGPLFDAKGNIIGIVSAKHRGAENVGYAIKASYLRNLMESTISTNILPEMNRISAQNLSGKVKAVKDFVYYILCSNDPNTSTTFYSNETNINKGVNTSDKIYNYPSVSSRYDKSLTLISVVIKSNETVLTISCKNDLTGGWMNIDGNAYIVANGSKYPLTRTEGIAYSPSYTYFSYQGESKTFKLHFQAIPQNTTSIDFVENANSQWRLYGISLK